MTDKKQTLGRPKSFDKDEIISIAMHYFWEHGYENSSLDDLLNAMGIKKSSFYNTFKSKEEFFSLTLDLYSKKFFGWLTELKDEKGVKYALDSLTRTTIQDLENSRKIKGCLLINSGKECYGKYHNLSEQIRTHFNNHVEFFTNLIQEGKLNNEISNSLDSKVIASRYLSIFCGLITSIQVGADNEVINNVMDSMRELIT